MNDSELDDLLSRYGDGYNRPPAKPPLSEIRERVHAAATRRKRQWVPLAALAAAAVAVLAVGLARDFARPVTTSRPVPIVLDTNRARLSVTDERVKLANAALAYAIELAEAAARDNPGDSYFREHLEAMRANAEEFRQIQQRQLAGTI